MEISKPPAVATDARRKLRRFSPGSFATLLANRMIAPLSQPFGRTLDRLANAHIGGAAAQVPAHGLLDVRFHGSGPGFEQRNRAHDLPALAVAALHDVLVDPRVLDGAAYPVPADALDGDDRTLADRRYR